MERFKPYVLLFVSVAVIFFGLKIVHAPTQIVLLVGGGITAAIAIAFGTKWERIQEEIFGSISSMLIGILIVLLIGCLIGAWILSGVVPVLIYYGLKFISPTVFLLVTALICSVMSVFTGTSWGTIGTVGIALIAVSQGLGIPLPYTAGAIITGALFGDKLSPMSDTTIMAPTLSGVDVIEHIKHMLYTTIPGYLISLIIYTILGFRIGAQGMATGEETKLILDTLSASFNLNPVLLIVPVITLVLIIKKVPSIPAFGIGIFLGCLFAGIFQSASLADMGTALYSGFKGDTGVELVDKMLTRGGLSSMFGTVALFIAAAVFGAPLKAAGVLDFLISKLTDSTSSWKTVLSGAYILNIIIVLILSSYYALFTLMGPILRPVMDRYGIPRKNLSRMLEDTGTATAWITPWNVTGIFAVTTLGVSISEFAPYAPMTYLGVVFGLIYIFTGFKPALGNIEPVEKIEIDSQSI